MSNNSIYHRLTTFFLLSLLSLGYFSPRRGCPRVLKFSMGWNKIQVVILYFVFFWNNKKCLKLSKHFRWCWWWAKRSVKRAQTRECGPPSLPVEIWTSVIFEILVSIELQTSEIFMYIKSSHGLLSDLARVDDSYMLSILQKGTK